MITRNDNSFIIIAVVNTGVIFLILLYNDPLRHTGINKYASVIN